MGFFGKSSKKNKNADELTAEGNEHLERGDAATALQAFTAAVKIDPQHGQAWYCKGCAHRGLGQFNEAIHAYQESVKFAGERAALPLFNLGNLYQELLKIDDAINCFRRAIEVDPSCADAWINLGRLLDDSGQHAKAIEYYDTALKLAPDDTIAWANRGNSLRALDRFVEALASFRRALECDGSYGAARVGVGACLVECGEPDQGVALLKEMAEETGHSLVLFEYATALAKTKEFEAAVGIYDFLIEHEFESRELWNNRGESLGRLGRFDEALESFDRSIGIDSDFAPAWFGKARVLLNAERIPEAQPVAKKYWQLSKRAERDQPAVRELMRACGFRIKE